MTSLLTVNPILIAAAVIPAVILLVRVYKEDRLDKEPKGLLLSLVLFGILSTIIALALEVFGTYVLSRFLEKDSLLYNVILYFVVVACSEEGAKYILLRLRTWRSPHFNCQFDGVVYAVFVSLGFALWENIGYVVQNGMATALVRAVTAVPGHACFGVFMGVFYGAAKRFDGMHLPILCKRYRRLALLFPVLMHGTYDFIATVSAKSAGLIFLVFIVIMFIVCYRLVKSAAAYDRYIVPSDDPDAPVPVSFDPNMPDSF
jgi:RsiW-degrading membrane proteinase PrsW (M82 family)